MKAVVLELKNGKSAVLREDGVVLKVRGNYTVGETIELKPKPSFSFQLPNISFAQPQIRMAMTAAILVFAIFIGGMYNYTTVQAAGYVAVEDNIGLELVINRRNQVIAVNATDESGEKIKEVLEQDDIKGKSLEEALTRVNEVTQEEMQKEHPGEEWSGLTFHAYSNDSGMEERMNQEIEEIQNRKPQGEMIPSETIPSETPSQQMEPQDQPAPQENQPQDEMRQPEDEPAMDGQRPAEEPKEPMDQTAPEETHPLDQTMEGSVNEPAGALPMEDIPVRQN